MQLHEHTFHLVEGEYGVWVVRPLLDHDGSFVLAVGKGEKGAAVRLLQLALQLAQNDAALSRADIDAVVHTHFLEQGQ